MGDNFMSIKAPFLDAGYVANVIRQSLDYWTSDEQASRWGSLS